MKRVISQTYFVSIKKKNIQKRAILDERFSFFSSKAYVCAILTYSHKVEKKVNDAIYSRESERQLRMPQTRFFFRISDIYVIIVTKCLILDQ